MTDLPIIGAQLTVLDLPKQRDWLIEKNRDLELPEFCMADILAAPDPFIDMAKKALDGWQGRLGIHGPFAGFELDVKDREIREVVQKRLGQALDVCEKLGATQMVLHSPYDHWDLTNLDNNARARGKRISAVLDTLAPALRRAEALGVEMVLEVMAGGPPVDRFVSFAGDLLTHVHLQDADGYADRHWVLGEGTIPFAPIFAALGALKSNPRLIVEINEFGRVPEAVAHLERLGLGQ